MTRDDLPPEVQRWCAWAWQEGASASLDWTRRDVNVYAEAIKSFPHNPYEILEESHEH